MLVLKFGGTSVGSAKAIKDVYQIVSGIEETKIVVVSAMSGITDSLIKASYLATNGDREYEKVFNLIKEKHKNVSLELFGAELETVNELLKELEQILLSIFKLRELTPRANALVQSFGERLNARIVSKYFQTKGMKSAPVDATTFLITTSDYLDANPIYEESKKRALKVLGRYLKEGFTPVVTGYIGTSLDGAITTLGRGGSDFTATILGRLLDASAVLIYTDVDGVLTADPKIVKDAKTIEQLSFEEVRELSYFGAKVMHSKSLIPAMEKKIPIRVLNTFNPTHPGTLIFEAKESLKPKAVTSIKDVALVSIVGKGMQGLKGFAKRVFEVASNSNVNIIMIAQSSSEQTIDLFVRGSDSEKLVSLLKSEFENEFKLELVDKILVKKNLSIISVVGERLIESYGLHREIFRITSANGVDVVSVVQGSSLNSISFVVKGSDTVRTVNALHTELGLASKKLKVINIFQFGVGGVGSALIELVKENEKQLEQRGIKLNYIGLARSNSFAIFEEVREHLESGNFEFKHKGSPINILKTLPKNTVIVDVTNSDTMGSTLLDLLSLGYHVVTSNKKNLATDFDTFNKFLNSNGKFLFETTVGASLPVIKVIREFERVNDHVLKILAIPSGTLSFIFTRFNRGVELRKAIEEAIKLGYTEPNPVEDLVGIDLLRKGKILSYLIQRDLQPHDIEFECFTKAKTIEEFFYDDYDRFLSRLRELSKEGVVYPVVEITDKLRIYLKAFPRESSFGSLKEGENIFEIYLKSSPNIPITIKGLGAGFKLTAEGVLQDILSLEAYI